MAPPIHRTRELNDEAKIDHGGPHHLSDDSAFLREFKKLSGDDATPLLPEAQEKAIRDIPRDAEIVALFNKLAANDPLPPR